MTALVLTGALYSVFAPAQAADEGSESAAEAAGRELYERSCITCHGENLEGEPNRGPSLIGVGEAAVYFQVQDRKSTRLNSSHANISYAVFCLIKKHTRSLSLSSLSTP